MPDVVNEVVNESEDMGKDPLPVDHFKFEFEEHKLSSIEQASH